MTVTLITTIHRWEGMSIDTKPSSGISSGSTFHELDTGDKYIYLRDSWREDVSGPVTKFHFDLTNADIRRWLEKIYLELQAANIANGIEVT